jgi:heme exporter protein C
VLTLGGLVALPVVYASVARWGSVEHENSLALSLAPGVIDMLLIGMVVMGAGLAAYTVAAALTRLRIVILERERRSEWVVRLVGE